MPVGTARLIRLKGFALWSLPHQKPSTYAMRSTSDFDPKITYLGSFTLHLTQNWIMYQAGLQCGVCVYIYACVIHNIYRHVCGGVCEVRQVSA